MPIPFPAEPRAQFKELDELHPTERQQWSFIGDDQAPTFNRLEVLGANQLGIDVAYSPQGPGAVPYTFEGPADGTTNPVQLGSQKGDKILLEHLVQTFSTKVIL